jgi:phosphoglycolate phosphatase
VNVLFDLDGTLTDPRQGVLGCIRHAMESLGRTPPAEAVLERFIGPPLQDTFRTLLGRGDADLVAQAVQLYRKRFSDRGIYENSVYPGIAPALSELQARRFPLFIVTSKPQLFAARIADHFGLTHRFRGIYGSELDGTRSAKADLIRHVLTIENLEPAATVMVGDREHDIRGARANGLRAIGVLWGYGSREELEMAGANAMCTSPAELTFHLGDHAVPRSTAP